MTIEELNEAVADGSIDELIMVAEARQRKMLGRIADEISAKGGVRLVLLAGASSAGKTTTAKRLATQLRVNELKALHLSTDDYFVGDRRNPRDERGEFDYEHVDCVDAQRLAEDVNRLSRGERVQLRRFDFVRHEGYDSEVETALPEGGVIVLEGIHALNPKLTADVPDASKFRVFVEPVTQLEVFGLTRLSSRNARLLRRLVRDNQFRKMPPSETFRMWPKVIEGERKWIEPFREEADATFDSGLVYELAVIKPYVGGLLQRALKAVGETRMPKGVPHPLQLIQLLEIVSATDPSKVPGDSILRETIGSSQLEY